MKINLIEYFQRTVKLFPNKLSVSDNSSQLTFKELDQKAKLIAQQIGKFNKLNRPIAIFLPKTSDSVASFIATFYSGNCYAPLDVKNTINRIESILETLDPICIITNNMYLSKIEKSNFGIGIINLDELDSTKVTKENSNFKKCIDTDPAYIIHTSGSTGPPKGVVISHRSVIDYIKWSISVFEVNEKEVIGNQTPFIFDMSVLDTYLMMFTGATLHLIPDQMFMFPARLIEYLVAKEINFIFWVPSVYINVANLKLLDSLNIPLLKKVLFAGEVMPTKHLNYWINSLGKDVLYANLYGPTEVTVIASYYIVERRFSDDEVIPIGKPCRNMDILILNEENNLCKVNEQGELCVRGSALSSGYWKNLDKTNSVFVQNPLNDAYPEKIYRTGDNVFINNREEIIYVGRKDFQIKHLGYRIELGEIEHTILSVFESLSICVLYDHQNKEIVLVYDSINEIPVSEFRIKLNTVLSKYMIPTRYVKIENLPLTSSGKIDRVYLNKTILEI